jgi:hypothetical protein
MGIAVNWVCPRIGLSYVDKKSLNGYQIRGRGKIICPTIRTFTQIHIFYFVATFAWTNNGEVVFFLLVIPWLLNFACRRFGTLCFIFIVGVSGKNFSFSHHLWRWNWQSVPKHRHIEFRSRESPKRKNTTFRTRRKFEIKSIGEVVSLRTCKPQKSTCYISNAFRYTKYLTERLEGQTLSWHKNCLWLEHKDRITMT